MELWYATLMESHYINIALMELCYIIFPKYIALIEWYHVNKLHYRKGITYITLREVYYISLMEFHPATYMELWNVSELTLQ